MKLNGLFPYLFMVLSLGLSACGSDGGGGDSTAEETGAEETGAEETGAEETGAEETGAEETGETGEPEDACDLVEEFLNCPECIGVEVTCSYEDFSVTLVSCGNCEVSNELYKALCAAGSEASAEDILAGLVCEETAAEETGAEETGAEETVDTYVSCWSAPTAITPGVFPEVADNCPAEVSTANVPVVYLACSEPPCTFEMGLGDEASGIFYMPAPPVAQMLTVGLALGPQEIRYRAINSAGEVDATPAIYAFTLQSSDPEPPVPTGGSKLFDADDEDIFYDDELVVYPTILDWNGDGRLDVFGHMKFYDEQGIGTWDFAVALQQPLFSFPLFVVEIIPLKEADPASSTSTTTDDTQRYLPVDFDGDGDRDFVANGHWLEATAEGYAAHAWEMGGVSKIRVPEVGDIDGDGDLDVVGLSFTDEWPVENSLVWIEQLAEGGHEKHALPDTLPEEFGKISSDDDWELADMDGDGDLDILVAHKKSYTLWLLENQLEAGFSPTILFEGPGISEYPTSGQYSDIWTSHTVKPPSVHAVDWNGDGLMDVFHGNLDKGIDVTLQTAPGVYETEDFAYSKEIHIGSGGYLLGDLNGDGTPDSLAFHHYSQEKENNSGHGLVKYRHLTWQMNSETEYGTAYETGSGARMAGLGLFDADHDGDLDAFAQKDTTPIGGIHVFDNDLFQCLPGFTGFDCSECTYPHASGANCDTCAPGWGGVHCSVCVDAAQCGD